MKYLKIYPKENTWIEGRLVKYFYTLANNEDVEKAYRRTHTNRGQKKVYQYTMEEELIAVHDSITKAAGTTAIDMSNISKVVDRENRTAGGYIWLSRRIA
jgi:hypothetical protein